MVFCDRVGDRIADTILDALRRAGTDGMTRTEINNLWNGRLTGERISAALSKLEAQRLARRVKQTTGGRPREVWRI